MSNIKIIFVVSEDKADRDYTASALGYSIHTQGSTNRRRILRKP